jgi:hypothetical protein
MIASLADAWQWYESVRVLTLAMRQLGRRHWGQLPWEGDLGRDNRLRRLDGGGRDMRRVSLVLVKACIAVVLSVIAARALLPLEKFYDDGLWPLSVTVRSASGKPIAAASGQAFGDAREAERVFQDLIPPETDLYSATQDPFRGQPLAVPVPTSYCVHSSLLWSHRRYFQFKKLVVIVQYEGGEREGRLVDIPDLRERRERVVDFP